MNDIDSLFEEVPRKRIGFFPTPIEKLGNISQKYDQNMYIKRDDLTGPGFGGNKIRKLEFIIADALEKGATHMITYGGYQTNHGRQMVSACRRFGLEPILFLRGTEKPEKFRGNLHLDKIMDAEIHYIPVGLDEEKKAMERATAEAEERIEELESEGYRCYDCPTGGFNVPGCLGFIWGFKELKDQLEDRGIDLDYIVHASGSGGTLTGLMMGEKISNYDVEILPFGVSKNEGKESEISKMSEKIADYLGIEEHISEEEVKIDYEHLGEGYCVPSQGSTNAVKELAREEGIILGPTYTAKAMAGLFDYIEKNKIPQNSDILFWHTGGTPTIFAERDIVGELYD